MGKHDDKDKDETAALARGFDDLNCPANILLGRGEVSATIEGGDGSSSIVGYQLVLVRSININIRPLYNAALSIRGERF